MRKDGAKEVARRVGRGFLDLAIATQLAAQEARLRVLRKDTSE